MEDEYELELEGSRTEVATALRDVADGLVAGSVRLGEGGDAISVDVPEDLSLEVELESDEDEIALELEVEWPRSAVGEDEISAVEATTGEDGGGSSRDSPDGPVSGGDDASAEASGDTEEEEESETASPVAAADGLQTMAGFEVFRDRTDEWRWRLRHRNGNVIATSGEGYTRKHNARKGLRSVVHNAPGAAVTEETDD